MSDLIDRQAAIDALDCINGAEEVLRALPSVQPEQKWIPCSERLPKKERRTYWVCTDAGTQHECRWTNNRFGMTVSDKWGWSIFDTPQYTKVIAWMPLPEPYREGGQDENR